MALNKMVIDVSHHNSITSFSSIAKDGVVGMIHKATQGGLYKDPAYVQRRGLAQKYGLLWGAYHFGTNADVTDQVNNFLDTATPDANTLVALDFEDNDSQMTLLQAKQWIIAVEEKLQRKVVLYSGNTLKDDLGSHKDPWWGQRKLWLAQYSSVPRPQVSWNDYFLWQYAEHGKVLGMDGDVDLNNFNGTLSELQSQWAK